MKLAKNIGLILFIICSIGSGVTYLLWDNVIAGTNTGFFSSDDKASIRSRGGTPGQVSILSYLDTIHGKKAGIIYRWDTTQTYRTRTDDSFNVFKVPATNAGIWIRVSDTSNSGPIGPTGPTGNSGINGSTGATGNGIQSISKTNDSTANVKMINGDSSSIVLPRGPIGLPGLTGPTGVSGAIGPTGLIGNNGSTGATGIQGPIGLTGSTGPMLDTTSLFSRIDSKLDKIDTLSLSNRINRTKDSIGLRAYTANISTVGFSGTYTDLSGKPIIPTNTNQLTNGAGFLTTEVDGSVTNELQNLSLYNRTISISSGNSITLAQTVWDSIFGKPSFSTVATTGSYVDLTNKPVIPSAFDSVQFFNKSGRIYKKLKVWIDTISVTSNSNFSVNISSAGFTNIISASAIGLKSVSGAFTSVPNVAVESMTTSAINLNFTQGSNNLVTLLGIGVLSGAATLGADVTGLRVAIIVFGY